MYRSCRANRLVKILDCYNCGRRLRTSQFRLQVDRAQCLKCGGWIVHPGIRQVPQEQADWRSIKVVFGPSRMVEMGYAVNGLALDCKTTLGPRVTVSSESTLRRMLLYLGATEEEIADFDECLANWNQGSTTITLAPGRKNLLWLRNH